MSGEELSAHVNKLQGESPATGQMREEVERRVATAGHSGADTPLDLLRVEGAGADEGARLEAVTRLYCSSLRDAASLCPEMLLPLPQTLGVGERDLLTPFPLAVEAPALSGAFACRELLTAILDRAGSASPAELRVS